MSPPPRILDSHHHLWDYDPAQYAWINPQTMSPLAQSYTLNDLREHSAGCNLTATVAVQARQTLEETDWLLELAADSPLCVGVVGWVPLQDPNIDTVLERYADQPLLKGVRHVIHDEPDRDFMLRPDFLRGLRALGKTALRYDILIFGLHLPNTIALVDQFPDQPFVVDHIAKPVIDSTKFDAQWAKDLAELAKREHVCCKLSGMVTEVRNDQWDAQTLRPYVDHVLEVFGPDRLMFGSDWPVCRLRAEYDRWVSLASELTATLSAGERDKVFYQNAAEFYRINQAG